MASGVTLRKADHLEMGYLIGLGLKVGLSCVARVSVPGLQAGTKHSVLMWALWAKL